ncbi:peroxidase 10-like [Impatiens glandulifera]|uniref:peroxidase 10-like n=1 Tax=Impatiens glandulifera TaxID=253017 RepID=UPI001FB07B7A|nr:peroxidase 10-like [Impatiens glandulifera]
MDLKHLLILILSLISLMIFVSSSSYRGFGSGSSQEQGYGDVKGNQGNGYGQQRNQGNGYGMGNKVNGNDRSNPGNGYGQGNQGYGSESGQGQGYGYGQGNQGNGNGYGQGNGNEYGSGNQGNRDGYGSGNQGSGNGYGSGNQGSGNGYGSGNQGNGNGYGSGNQGNGNGYGSGNQGNGNGYGSGNQGNGNGYGSGNQGDGNGYGSGNQGNGNGYGSGNQGNGNDYGSGNQGNGNDYGSGKGQVGYYFYDNTCPKLIQIVRYWVMAALKNETRIAASLLRLHFHDCFVNGCDASILLDDTKSFKGEKNALPNKNSVRGFELIENIKADIEKTCPSTVSCVDILALAAREAVYAVGGPYWSVVLGRRDGLTASEKAANTMLPSPFEPVDNITAKFVANGLDMKDVVVLSGAHTIGFAQCFTFKKRLYNFKGTGKPDPNMDATMMSTLQGSCTNDEKSNSQLITLDASSTDKFDNSYYKNLVGNSGLLDSDQALMLDSRTSKLVNSFSSDSNVFNKEFAASMVKLGNIGVLIGNAGQVRKKCGAVN